MVRLGRVGVSRGRSWAMVEALGQPWAMCPPLLTSAPELEWPVRVSRMMGRAVLLWRKPSLICLGNTMLIRRGFYSWDVTGWTITSTGGALYQWAISATEGALGCVQSPHWMLCKSKNKTVPDVPHTLFSQWRQVPIGTFSSMTHRRRSKSKYISGLLNTSTNWIQCWVPKRKQKWQPLPKSDGPIFREKDSLRRRLGF